MVKYRISSSERGRSIVFNTKQAFDDYDRDILAVIKKHKLLQQQQIGYWASNQEKFVKSISELNEWDSKDYAV